MPERPDTIPERDAAAGEPSAAARDGVPEESAPVEVVEVVEVVEPAEPPGDAEPAEPGESPEPGDAVAQERDRYLSLAQRTQADFENYRKRMARETAVAADRGVTRLAKELLPALDHLSLALKAVEDDDGELAKGVRLVQAEIVGALGRVGIQPFSPQGEPFDPTEHEAMASHPSEEAEPGTVIEVYQQGYRLNGSVLRPARVVVAG